MFKKERTAELKRIVWKSTAVLLFVVLFSGLFGASPPQRQLQIIDFALDVEIFPEKSWLKGEAEIECRAEQDGLDRLEFYLRPSLKVSSARDEGGQELLFSQVGVERIFPNSDTSLVRIILGRRFSKGEKLKLAVSYSGQFFMSSSFNPQENRYNRAFSSITREAAWLRHVQLWYPYFPDQSMGFTVRAQVPPGWTVVTNGRLKDAFEDKGHKVFVYREEKLTSLDPILFAAPYIVVSQKVKNFQVTAYLFPEHERLIHPYLTKTAEIVGFFQEKFGPPAAETFSVLEIGTGYGTGTSAPFGYAIASHLIGLDFPLIPHEIAHLWWGETVSDDLGEDTWLHEGLATFSDYFYRTEKAPTVLARKNLLFEWLDKAIPVGNPETLNILEAGAQHAPEGFLVYERAAFMVRTLKHLLGEELFFKALRAYVETYRGIKADTAGFVQLFSDVAGQNLRWFFDFYLLGTRPQRYGVLFENQEGRVRGILHQEHAPEDFRMPVPLEVVTDHRSFRRTVEVRGREREFAFTLGGGERVQKIVVDPDFQILGVREVLEDRWTARDLRIAASESKNFEEFEPRLTSLHKKHPDNIPILHEVAQFYAAQEKWDKAIEVYRRILEREPGEFAFVALANIAGAYEKIGDKQNEKLYLEKALAKGSSMYSIMRSLMDKLEKLKE